MKQIFVAMEHGGQTHPVGVIRFDPVQKYGYFAYLPTYDGPPLDPINLNYRKPFVPGAERLRRDERLFFIDAANAPGLMHQVFVDAMPGQWGMQVLQAEYPEIRQMRDAEKLHWMGARTSGAISFFVDRRAPENTVHGLEELEAVRAKCAEFMAKLQKMGLEGVRNPAVASHGGVMPKAAYEDSSGRHWIAKFDRPGEGLQYALLEHATSQMAARCGIDVPQTKAIADGVGGHMFLTERFDRTPGERYHKASMMTLLGARDAGSGDYRDMFAALKEICDPAIWPAQRDELLRRMAFNIGLNVTDDHLRNHEVRLMPNGTWELAPAFDLVPVSGPSPHQCALFGRARADINLDKPETKQFWTHVAAELGATPEHIFGIVRGVSDTLKAEWAALLGSTGLNRYNQMNGAMAAEVGCAAPFPSGPAPAPTVPLGAGALHALKTAGVAIARAAAAFKGAELGRDAATQLSRDLMAVNGAAPQLVAQLRQAGLHPSAEALAKLQLRTAAGTVLEGDRRDHHLASDFEEMYAHVRSCLASAAQKAEKMSTPKPAGRTPR